MLDPQALIGQQIGDYRVQTHLARGGMADVYLAQDTSLGRQVVLKIMLPMLAENSDFVERFQREARTTANLNHPNIIHIYQTGQLPEGRPYIAMQYVSGGTLEERLAQQAASQQHLPTATALRLMRHTAEALATAHSNGIVHRDFKPSNILLQPDGTPILTDLGIAMTQDTTRLTHTGSVMGTPHYMSPEQASGQPLDGRSDLYSLGIILYEMLAGQPPFVADSPLAVLHKHIYEPPPALELFRPDLTAVTHTIIDRCLQKEAANRYANAGELVAALSQALVAENDHISTTQQPTIAISPQTQPAATQPARSMWGWAIGGGLLAVLLVGILWAVLGPTSEPPDATATIAVITPTVAEATATMATTEVSDVGETAVPATRAPTPTKLPTPTLIPLQQKIVFQSNRDGDYDIYVMDINGNNQQPLTENDVVDELPVTAPNGKQILFQSERDGNMEIYSINIDGSNLRRLTNNLAQDRLPTWSPDSQKVAFISDRNGNFNIYTMNADGSNVQQLTFDDERTGHMSWSVNNEIVFNSGTSAGSTWEIYVMQADGSQRRQLTDNNVSDWSPEWSPDGRSILYLSIVSGSDPAIFIMNRDGSGANMVYNSPAYEWGADWTKNGRQILFTAEINNTSTIYQMNADGSNATPISDRGSYPSWSEFAEQ